jgi:hypothetical protein
LPAVYLKQLHDIVAVQEIFSVLIDGGIKSRFNKTKPIDNTSSVHLMNEILFEFARKFTKFPPMCLDWPAISFDEQSYRPVLAEYHLVHKLKQSGLQVMSLNPDFFFENEISQQDSVVNSKGDVIVLKSWHTRTIKLFKSSGESRTLCLDTKEKLSEPLVEGFVAAMDIDAEDNMYLIIKFRENDNQFEIFKLFIFNENGSKKLECPLPFDRSSYEATVRMAIDKNGKIAVFYCKEKILYIGDVERNTFEVQKRLHLREVDIMAHFFSSYAKVRFADFSGTKIIAADYHAVSVYSVNGQLEREITVPEEHGTIDSVAINHVTKRILVKTYHPSGRSLLSFSENGELIERLYLGSSEWIKEAEIISHPKGPVALVGKIGAALIQL